MYEKFVAELRELADGADPKDVALGICVVAAQHQISRDFLKKVIGKWPEHSGSSQFPIPHKKLSPKEAFYSTPNLWVGSYGSTRRRLCTFIADTLEDFK